MLASMFWSHSAVSKQDLGRHLVGWLLSCLLQRVGEVLDIIIVVCFWHFFLWHVFAVFLGPYFSWIYGFGEERRRPASVVDCSQPAGSLKFRMRHAFAAQYKLRNSKTKLFCETSCKNGVLKLKTKHSWLDISKQAHARPKPLNLNKDRREQQISSLDRRKLHPPPDPSAPPPSPPPDP